MHKDSKGKWTEEFKNEVYGAYVSGLNRSQIKDLVFDLFHVTLTTGQLSGLIDRMRREQEENFRKRNPQYKG